MKNKLYLLLTLVIFLSNCTKKNKENIIEEPFGEQYIKVETLENNISGIQTGNITTSYINEQNETLSIIGYNQMEWGTTIDIFMSLYMDADDITFGYTGYGRTPDFKIFRQFIGDDKIKYIDFFFYQNKLYKVEERFIGVENFEIEIFLNEMVTKYGTVDTFSERRESEGNAYWDHFEYEIQNSSDLFVIVIVEQIYKKVDDSKFGNEISIIFKNPSIDQSVESIRKE
jgi:hypothetical protein